MINDFFREKLHIMRKLTYQLTFMQKFSSQGAPRSEKWYLEINIYYSQFGKFFTPKSKKNHIKIHTRPIEL